MGKFDKGAKSEGKLLVFSPKIAMGV
ncbi:uncharacterized protein G2W53_035872 [Senna tora]|uniref:Uncharacterized protein n=1 Tax=Senna tora TaxID=362788 RepID=A0A834T451_9FABA|nr:uncharacterized protein G2W53_035872 [Senna tora]